jgi:hypothetical protein
LSWGKTLSMTPQPEQRNERTARERRKMRQPEKYVIFNDEIFNLV